MPKKAMMARFRGEYLTLAREREIQEFAEFVADEHCPHGKIDPLAVARAKGITVSENDYGDSFDGLLEHKAGRFHIYCNTGRDCTEERRRFTIGHELGHYFIDEHREALRSGLVPSHGSLIHGSSRNPVEREADAFSSGLLMPRLRVEKAIHGRSCDMSSALHLAHIFGVSPIAAALRLLGFERDLLAIIWWENQEYVWKRLSRAARGNGLRKTIETVEGVLRDSPTGKVFGGDVDTESGFITAATTASAWFPWIEQGQKQDQVLMEDAIQLGGHGVLTMLRMADRDLK